MPRLLIVDDEPNVRYSLEKTFRADGVDVVSAENGREGLRLAQEESPDAVLLDVRLPDMSGLDVFAQIRAHDRRLPVIIMTAHTTTETAIEAMKRGAFEYLLKPFDLTELKETVAKAFETSRLSRVRTVFEHDPDELHDDGVDHIVGTSPAMQSVYKEIGRVAPQNVNVLILGESGTGKELVARAVYQHSQRHDGPFIAINCAAIPETLLESELFGHEKGSFTGADRRRIGKFEQAIGGTMFLDEIGEMSLATQAKFLRVLQDGRFERVGGNETIFSDARIIAATNRDLRAAIDDRDFREDLFYRLNVFTIDLPPLRDRRADLPQLVNYLLRRFNAELGTQVHGVSETALDMLSDYNWPGNVRELQSAIKYALVRATTDVITPESLPTAVRGETPQSDAHADSDAESTLRELARRLIQEHPGDVNQQFHTVVDRVLCEEVLAHVEGHQARAAELLGISRTTLRARLQVTGLVVGKSVKSDS
ncbi:MAG TPA: sigma-54-dependent Fis family transcriptional regulator [Planctomycetes bacterium]|nr:sigma-54-dependent Fis family transcriptional regulator [Fuerstiella sp.]HIK95130.1 sigma-54-dependent Fis family transcriptional regulator [Planctomycetota bacterium]